uniref:DNA mismatch repair proteins mutS family domain-containing protein n=1 Tax=Mucochytrium quahogii TaxID=96639 RepID=A0A7S2W9Y4_9STRA|mmetsp:Transcript_20804/g.33968  ORF Transcript_20804/g.33968 Transcript_20804/m.33968 type:complete len:798 (-) Transcript_20804:34-2427(-)
MSEQEEDDIGQAEGVVCCICRKFDKEGCLVIGVSVLNRGARGLYDSTTEKDARDFMMTLYEFVDCDQLTNLESLLVRVCPTTCYHEVLENDTTGFKRRLEQVLGGIGVNGTSIAADKFKYDEFEIEDKVREICGEKGSEELKGLNSEGLSLKSLIAVIYMENMVDEHGGRVRLVKGDLNQFVRLDAAAIEALNLLPTKSNSARANQKESSVHGVLNSCVTKQLGSRLLRQWILQPLLDAEKLAWRHDIVGALKDDQTRRDAIRNALKGVPDLHRILRKFERKKAGLREIYELYLFVQALPKLEAALKSPESGESEPIQPLCDFADQVGELCTPERFDKYCEMVDSMLDFSLVPREFRVQAKHDESGEMIRLIKQLEKIECKVDDEREALLEKELCAISDAKFETDPSFLQKYGYHFVVKKAHDNILKGIKGAKYKYLVVSSKGVRWSTTTLKSLYDQHMSVSHQLGKAQSKLVKLAAETASTFLQLFEVATTLVATLDVLQSLAHVAAYAPADYVRPTMVPIGDANDGKVKITQGRHPCLEMIGTTDFIANDYLLEEKSSKFQIITGPNMGGKSTYIRQIGTIMIMAQIGSFVPCQEAELPIVDAVLARVGASDEQLKGISTFMAEMIEASAIVKTATKHSLVIIDELGRGTSTYDGFGLAWAISEHLANNIKPFCLFATHFHELTALSNKFPSVTNKHVAALATDESLTMLYSVNDGPCMESFGINIAKMAGFPDDVVTTAKRKAAELESLDVISATEPTGDKKQRSDKVKEILDTFSHLDNKNLNVQHLKTLLVV